MSFVVQSFILSFFLITLGLACVYVGSKAPPKYGFLPIRTVLLINVIMYFGAALWIAYSAAAFVGNEAVTSECENVINSSVYIDATTTRYTYVNSCDGNQVPPSGDANSYLFGACILVTLMELLIFAMYSSFAWLGRRW